MAHDTDRTDDASANRKGARDRKDGPSDEGRFKGRQHQASRKDVIRTWGILILLMVGYALWFGIIYLLEPGIR